MGFFSDLKEDLSQAVNELLPEEAPAETADTGETVDVSLEEMLKNIDNIEIPMDELDPDGTAAPEPSEMDEEIFGLVSDIPALDAELESLLADLPDATIDGTVTEIPADEIPAEEPTTTDDASAWPELVLDIPKLGAEDVAALMTETTSQPEMPAYDAPAEEPVADADADAAIIADTMAEAIPDVMADAMATMTYEMPAAEAVAEADAAIIADTMADTMADAAIIADAVSDPVADADVAYEMPAEPSVAEAPVAAESTPQRQPDVSYLADGLYLQGGLISKKSVEVAGVIDGNVEVLGKLSVSGVINGNSKAAEVYTEGGRINGEIYCDGAVKIGKNSVVIGNIVASCAAIAGAVKGDIDVQGPVILDSSAMVMGNIKSKSMQINNGAVVEGVCSQCYADVSLATFFDDYTPNH